MHLLVIVGWQHILSLLTEPQMAVRWNKSKISICMCPYAILGDCFSLFLIMFLIFMSILKGNNERHDEKHVCDEKLILNQRLLATQLRIISICWPSWSPGYMKWYDCYGWVWKPVLNACPPLASNHNCVAWISVLNLRIILQMWTFLHCYAHFDQSNYCLVIWHMQGTLWQWEKQNDIPDIIQHLQLWYQKDSVQQILHSLTH